MSELPGTAAVAIDGVEWSAAGAGRLTVAVSGGWRRRRPGWTGQPALLVEVGGRRQRYPAMPEPPSLAGTAPGTWRLRFSLPGEVAPELGRMWLALGGAMIPLPAAVRSPAAEPVAPAEGSGAVDAGAPTPVAEVPPPAALATAIAGLGREPAASPAAERDRLRFERELRVARQGAANRALDVPPAADRGAAGSELASALRAELDARARGEAELRARLAAAEGRLAARIAIERRTTEVVAELRRELDTLGRALARERERREAAEQRARELERTLDAQWMRSRGASSAIAGLREELRQLAELAAAPVEKSSARPGPTAIASTPADAGAAELPSATNAPPGSLIEPERLAEARERLRGAIPGPQAPAPVQAGAGQAGATARERRPLESAFRRLVHRDPVAAGRLLLALLPMQASVWPEPIAYDLVLANDRCLAVTSGPATTALRVRRARRSANEAELWLIGDPARLARLLVAGRLRRLTGWGVARIQGRRGGVSALSALLRAPLDPAMWHRAGVRIDAATALSLVAAAIEPGWTRGERFVLACGEPGGALVQMTVEDGRAPVVACATSGRRFSTTVRCRAGGLLRVLTGERVSPLTVDGDERPLRLVRDWLQRATSG